MGNEVDPNGDWVEARIALTESCSLVVQNTISGRVQCFLTPNSASSGSSVEVRFSDASLDFLRRLLDGGGAYSYADHPSVSSESVTDCVRQIRDRLVEHLAPLDTTRSVEDWRGVVKQVIRTKHGQGYVIDSSRLQMTRQTWPPEKSAVPTGSWDESRLNRRKSHLRSSTMPVKAQFVREWAHTPARNVDGLGQYSFTIDGSDVISTPMLTRPEWCSLSHGTLLSPKDVKMVSVSRGTTPRWEPPRDLSALAARYAQRLFTDNTRLDNLPTYRLLEIDLPRSVKFEVVDFFDYRFSTGLLEDEFANQLLIQAGSPDLSDVRPEQMTALRNLLLPDLQSLTDFPRRLCAGGLGTVLACNKEDTNFNVMLQVRGGTVSDGQGLQAVIPKAFHQPEVVEDLGRTFHGCTQDNVYWTVLRELHEEVFGGDAMLNPDDPASRFDWFMSDNPTMGWFQSNQSQWQLALTSFGLNGVSGNYDFGLAMCVLDPRFYEKQQERRMWESKRHMHFDTFNADKVVSLLQQPNWAGESLFHLVEGLAYLQQAYPDKVRLPRLRRFVGDIELEDGK